MAVSRSTEAQERALRQRVQPPGAVWAKAPAVEAFLPLVLLLAVVGPGLVAWLYGSLTSASAARGLCALDVLDGDWLLPGPTGQPAPPLVAWVQAMALTLPLLEPPVALLVPSYLFAVGSLFVLYLLGGTWFTRGTGMLACFLMGLCPYFLAQVRTGSSGPIVLFFFLVSLLVYTHHLLAEDEVFSYWTLGGAFAFGGLLLSLGFNAFWLPVLALVNVFFREAARQDREWVAARAALWAPTTRAGVIVVTLGTLLAIPWILFSGLPTGPTMPWIDPGQEQAEPASMAALVWAMPATIVLGVFGFLRSLRQTILRTKGSARAAPALLWTLFSLFALQTTLPTATGVLLAATPLTLFAVRTLIAILRRELADRTVLLLILGSGAVVLLCSVPWDVVNPRRVNSLDWVVEWSRHSSDQKWQAHLAADEVVLFAGTMILLYLLSQGSDRHRRWLFGGFLFAILLVSLVEGLGVAPAALRRDDPWQRVYEQLPQSSTVGRVVTMGSLPPPEELRFLLRARYGGIPREHIQGREQLPLALRDPAEQPLVLVTEPPLRLPKTYPVARGDLTLILVERFDTPRVIGYTCSAGAVK